jgi:hypothetical protein
LFHPSSLYNKKSSCPRYDFSHGKVHKNTCSNQNLSLSQPLVTKMTKLYSQHALQSQLEMVKLQSFGLIVGSMVKL